MSGQMVFYEPNFFTLEEARKKGLKSCNAIITGARIEWSEHFDQLSFHLACDSASTLVSLLCQPRTWNIGPVIDMLLSLLALKRFEDFDVLKKLTGKPVRLLHDGDRVFGEFVGIGHFIQDRFVLTRDLLRSGLITPEELEACEKGGEK